MNDDGVNDLSNDRVSSVVVFEISREQFGLADERIKRARRLIGDRERCGNL